MLSPTVGVLIPLRAPGQSHLFGNFGAYVIQSVGDVTFIRDDSGRVLNQKVAVCNVGRDIDALEQALAEQPTEEKGA